MPTDAKTDSIAAPGVNCDLILAGQRLFLDVPGPGDNIYGQ